MGVFDRLERGLERAVKAPFARVFKAEVQPVEIASAMRGAMDDRAAVLGPGRTMVPNVFTIELAETDHERLSSFQEALTDELVAAAEDHADAQRYVAPGPFEVHLVAGDDLETGIFRVRPAAKDGRRGRSGSEAREYADTQRRGRESRGRGETHAAHHPDERRGTEDPHAAYRPPAPPEPEDRAGREGRGGREVRAGRERRGRGGPALVLDGQRVPLTAAVTTLGRDESATIVVDDPGASRRHAEIRITHDGPHLQVILRDLSSTNGTYLNGEQVGSEELHHGDRITVGRTHLLFSLEE